MSMLEYASECYLFLKYANANDQWEAMKLYPKLHSFLSNSSHETATRETLINLFISKYPVVAFISSNGKSIPLYTFEKNIVELERSLVDVLLDRSTQNDRRLDMTNEFMRSVLTIIKNQLSYENQLKSVLCGKTLFDYALWQLASAMCNTIGHCSDIFIHIEKMRNTIDNQTESYVNMNEIYNTIKNLSKPQISTTDILLSIEQLLESEERVNDDDIRCTFMKVQKTKNAPNVTFITY
jgi:hypothetical protein